MLNSRHRLTVVALALIAGGCDQSSNRWQWWQPNGPSQATPAAAASQPSGKTIGQLRSENEMLRADNEKMAELRLREQQLAKKVEELQFINSQQEQMIKTLKEAPVERDQLKEKVKNLQDEIDRLKQSQGETQVNNQKAPSATSRSAE